MIVPTFHGKILRKIYGLPESLPFVTEGEPRTITWPEATACIALCLLELSNPPNADFVPHPSITGGEG